MTLPSYTPALAGGALIGFAALSMLLLNGRIAGVSGAVKGLLASGATGHTWRLAFLFGLVAGGALVHAVHPAAFAIATDRPLGVIALAGLLVGIGSSLANGCTSGHGVCGVGRLSRRSLVATATFMLAGFATVVAWKLARSAM